jgi:hypothetical protein
VVNRDIEISRWRGAVEVKKQYEDPPGTEIPLPTAERGQPVPRRIDVVAAFSGPGSVDTGQ